LCLRNAGSGTTVAPCIDTPLLLCYKAFNTLFVSWSDEESLGELVSDECSDDAFLLSLALLFDSLDSF
jgi:hypothetical protein